MDRIELLLAQLHQAALTMDSLDDQQNELLEELRAALQDATTSAHRLRLQKTLPKSIRLA
jgi:two-component SAPR family response regulator